MIGGLGTIFKMTPNGRVTVLHDFTTLEGNGSPAGLVEGLDGNFYGTTERGGAHFWGSVSKVTRTGKLTTLYSFSADFSGSNADGAVPAAALVLGTDGNFYGTTERGDPHDTGTILKITSGGTLTTVYTFSALTAGDNGDGAYPAAALTLSSDGAFYGTTSQGGANGSGTVFRITASGTFTTLCNFNALQASRPVAPLIQGGDGAFYGTASRSGAAGAVFKVTSDGVLTVLHTFTGESVMAATLLPAWPSARTARSMERPIWAAPTASARSFA